ncbi:PQQ-dependent sugar dehydrogenase [Nodularia sp. UHCC 0506]|uniref:PQQ-dependent sugar dehydrogenase n=1 Tax=Nodularia sp. UHCC 0506 TaxID=3110243 RepID=UPI002B20468D|nr:PQQ-dependent sugar dehydrogenase [Nodularia sp. UHCC 0506]MEA5512445.1 PQQ-dependent sugar dehydrogenase [Nodularia sp. UHCC 0506]
MKLPKTIKLLISLSLMGLVSCNGTPTESIDSQTTSPVNATSVSSETPACKFVTNGVGSPGKVQVKAEEVVTGLEVPWGIAFLPNDKMLVTERPGRVRLVENGELKPPIATVNVTASGEGGLLGIATHPDFATNRFFYLYYTTDKNGSPVNRVERWQLSSDGLTASLDRIIIDDIPAAIFHNGGRLRFGPDGMLYIGTGDAREPQLSQNVESLAGKILRLTPDGNIPTDNPFPNNPVFITGIRNTQGFDWYNPSTLFVTDHGPSGELGRRGEDKVSVLQAGDNMGWPAVENCEAEAEFVRPSLVWREAAPPGGAAIYTGDSIPEWKGNLIIGTLRSRHLHRVVFDSDNPSQVLTHEVYFPGNSPNGFGRIRDVIMGTDGELYITTSNCDGRGNCPQDQDKIIRITQ